MTEIGKVIESILRQYYDNCIDVECKTTTLVGTL